MFVKLQKKIYLFIYLIFSISFLLSEDIAETNEYFGKSKSEYYTDIIDLYPLSINIFSKKIKLESDQIFDNLSKIKIALEKYKKDTGTIPLNLNFLLNKPDIKSYSQLKYDILGYIKDKNIDFYIEKKWKGTYLGSEFESLKDGDCIVDKNNKKYCLGTIVDGKAFFNILNLYNLTIENIMILNYKFYGYQKIIQDNFIKVIISDEDFGRSEFSLYLHENYNNAIYKLWDDSIIYDINKEKEKAKSLKIKEYTSEYEYKNEKEYTSEYEYKNEDKYNSEYKYK